MYIYTTKIYNIIGYLRPQSSSSLPKLFLHCSLFLRTVSEVKGFTLTEGALETFTTVESECGVLRLQLTFELEHGWDDLDIKLYSE